MPADEWGIVSDDPGEGGEVLPEVPYELPPLAGATLTRTRLILPENLPFEQWEQVGETLKSIEKSVHWWLGDWLAYGERTYGETYAQAAEITGYTVKTLQNDVYVAQAIEPSRRREDVDHSTHSAVAGLPPEKQDTILERAAAEKLDVGDVRTIVREERATIENPLAPVLRVTVREGHAPTDARPVCETRSYATAEDAMMAELKRCIHYNYRAEILITSYQGEGDGELLRRAVTGWQK